MKAIKILFIIALTFSSTLNFAQEKDKGTSKKDKRDAIRVAIITEKLELTDDEAKTFWPLYDQMVEDHKKLRQNYRETKEEGKKMDELTDEEVEDIIMESFDFKQKELDLKKQYHIKLKEVLPIKKVAKLYHLEKRLNQEMRDRFNKEEATQPSGR